MIRSSGLRAGMAGGAVMTAGLAVGVLVLADLWPGAPTSDRAVASGKAIYAEHCATCHGVNLEGQPDWQVPLDSGRLPAPPHDASGHTWHHPDEVLFEVTKRGTTAVVGGDYKSDMPGFEATLTDDQIRAVLAYIKSTWPARERSYQEERTRQADEPSLLERVRRLLPW